MQSRHKMGRSPELLSNPHRLVRNPVPSNFTKIQFLEQCLERVYEHQKHSIEKLKFLSLENLNNQPNDDETTLQLVEDNVKSLYNTAVEYSQAIKRVAAVDEFEIGDHQFNDPSTESTGKNKSALSDELESSIWFDSDKQSPQAPPIRVQSLSSITEEEQLTIKWDLMNFRQKTVERDFIGFGFDSGDNEFEPEDLSMESTNHQEKLSFERKTSWRKPSIFS